MFFSVLRLHSNTSAGWTTFEQRAGPILAAELANHAPIGGINDLQAGTLAGSMTWQDNEGVLEAGSTDERLSEYGGLARLNIRGTRAHPIDPTGPWPLHFFLADGTEVFTMHVEHPGTQPNPFNREAWDAARREVLAIFREECPRGVLRQLNPWRKRTI